MGESSGHGSNQWSGRQTKSAGLLASVSIAGQMNIVSDFLNPNRLTLSKRGGGKRGAA